MYSHAFRGKGISLLKCTLLPQGYPSALPPCGSSERRAIPGLCYVSMLAPRQGRALARRVQTHTGSCGGGGRRGQGRGARRAEPSESAGRGPGDGPGSTEEPGGARGEYGGEAPCGGCGREGAGPGGPGPRDSLDSGQQAGGHGGGGTGTVTCPRSPARAAAVRGVRSSGA